MDGSGSVTIDEKTSSSGRDAANKIVLVVSEEVGEETADDIACDAILDGPVNFCCANASTKQLLRSLVCINIVVITMQNRHDEMNDDSKDCDLEQENIILKMYSKG
mmetsp:Transcript_40296/g.45416  ORF Transcript_40296/g.45416 Transcript_40296/m.45416 type:complete len:106 (-) Transcript_40296:73-390(-)